jgi:hypothetical protein
MTFTNATACNSTAGSVNITVGGGTTPYTYYWNGNGPLASTPFPATGLVAATYTASVKDAGGCSFSTTIVISQPYAIRDSIIGQQNIACTGTNTGYTQVAAKYGNQPFTYLWSPGGQTNAQATGLSAGIYSVTVKDRYGCTGTSTVVATITQPLLLRDSIVTASTVNVTCNGGNNGSAKVGVKYGTSPYTYLWSPGGQTNATASNLSVGTYTVAVNDKNGCTITSLKVAITQPNAIRDSIKGQQNIACEGTNTGVLTSGVKYGFSPYTYLWSPGGQTNAQATNLSVGTYMLTVIDKNGCHGSGANTTAVITQPAIIHDSIVSSLTTCTSNLVSATVGIKGGTSPYTYLWTPGGQTNQRATGLSVGTYTVTINDSHGCTYGSLKAALNCPPEFVHGEVKDSTQTKCCAGFENVSLFPNPNTGQFTLTGLTQGMIVELYDYTGRKISTITASELTIQLNISNQPNGVYLVRIISADGTMVTQKKVVKTQ